MNIVRLRRMLALAADPRSFRRSVQRSGSSARRFDRLAPWGCQRFGSEKKGEPDKIHAVLLCGQTQLDGGAWRRIQRHASTLAKSLANGVQNPPCLTKRRALWRRETAGPPRKPVNVLGVRAAGNRPDVFRDEPVRILQAELCAREVSRGDTRVAWRPEDQRRVEASLLLEKD